MISVGALGFVSDRVIHAVSRRLLRWRALESHA
jgi:hypothetical protein